MFIVVDGIDGAGKTTLVRQLGAFLSKFDPKITKEPTDLSTWGRQLRQSAKLGRLPKSTEIEFFHKDRLFHIETVILPALRTGRVVISDRYVDSTLAFQADGPADARRMYESFASQILIPDLSFILCCPVSIGLERIQKTRDALTTFEKLSTLERARLIYESRTGKNYALLDASGSVEHTFNQAIFEFCERFPQFPDQKKLTSEDLAQVAEPPSSLKVASNY